VRWIFPLRRGPQFTDALLDSYPQLRINAYAADYFQALDALQLSTPTVCWFCFLGQTSALSKPAECLILNRAMRTVFAPVRTLCCWVQT